MRIGKQFMQAVLSAFDGVGFHLSFSKSDVHPQCNSSIRSVNKGVEYVWPMSLDDLLAYQGEEEEQERRA